jgi:hypothetical protein
MGKRKEKAHDHQLAKWYSTTLVSKNPTEALLIPMENKQWYISVSPKFERKIKFYFSTKWVSCKQS